jgi:hypothetical protein
MAMSVFAMGIINFDNMNRLFKLREVCGSGGAGDSRLFAPFVALKKPLIGANEH